MFSVRDIFFRQPERHFLLLQKLRVLRVLCERYFSGSLKCHYFYCPLKSLHLPEKILLYSLTVAQRTRRVRLSVYIINIFSYFPCSGCLCKKFYSTVGRRPTLQYYLRQKLFTLCVLCGQNKIANFTHCPFAAAFAGDKMSRMQHRFTRIGRCGTKAHFVHNR